MNKGIESQVVSSKAENNQTNNPRSTNPLNPKLTTSTHREIFQFIIKSYTSQILYLHSIQQILN